jgi:mRNA interferase MazF
MEQNILRGEIYLANLRFTVNSEQNGFRPVLIIQNDAGNQHSSTVIIAAITSRMDKPALPTHVPVGTGCGLRMDSLILTEQIRTLDKRRLGKCIGMLTEPEMKAVDSALAISVGLVK